MKSILKISATLLIAFTAGAFSQLHAQLLIDPATVEYSGSTNGGAATQLINNSGLITGLGAPGTAISLPASYPTDDNNYADNFRASVGGGQLATLTFDLSAAYTITGLYVYNYNEGGTEGETGTSQPASGRGLASTDLQYSDDGGLTYSDYGTIDFTEATGTDSYTGFQLDLSAPLANVTNLEFVGGASFLSSEGEYYAGLGEVRFTGSTGAVPEPSTYALLGAGVLVLLVGLRRKANP